MTTTDDRTPPGDASPRVRTELAISGMTCGACSARIERRLARLDDVDASVNLTTERARVEHSPDRPVADLVALIEKLGFGAEVIPAATSAAPPAPAPVVPTARTAPDDAAAPAPTGPATGAVPATDGATTPPTTAAPADPTEAPPAPDPELADLRHRAFTCLALTVPVVAVAMIGSLQVTYWQWFSLMLAAPVVVWGGWRFHRSAAKHLRHGQVTMDTLVSLGSLAALGWSLGALFIGEAGLGGVRHNLTLIPRPDFYGGDRTIYLETGAAIITAVLFGRWIELRGRRRALAGSATHDPRPTRNARLRVPTANGLRELLVPVENLTVGDEVSVAPGAVVPCDGIVASGRAALDVAAMTGESAPAEAGPGTHVLAGTRSHHDGADGPLVVRATAVGDATQWARMGRHVADAQVGKASVQRLADRVSAFFVPAVLVLAVYTLVFWWFADGPDIAAAAAMAVLVVACPCALGLATPTALAVATGRGATLGILLRGPETLEATRRIDTVVLDKTGTLTTGDMTLHGVTVADGTPAGQVWRMVTALERDVDHPVARALLAAAPDAPAAPATRVERLDGLGVRGTLDGVEVLVGRPLLHERHHAVLDDDLAAARRAAEAAGHTVVLVSWPDSSDGTSDAASDRPAAAPRVRAVLAVGDTVRDTSAEGVARMRAMGLRPMLVTGDNAAAAAAVAAQVGIDGDDVVADVLPTDKADTVTRLQDAGHVVAMVGDGINDAAALARADLGMAMGAGTTLALDAADITLVRNDLRTVTDALRLARRTLRTIRGNLFWAFAYNTAALPLAALGLLNPMIAGLAMALSSIFVVGNSLRLRRFALRAGAEGTSGRG